MERWQGEDSSNKQIKRPRGCTRVEKFFFFFFFLLSLSLSPSFSFPLSLSLFPFSLTLEIHHLTSLFPSGNRELFISQKLLLILTPTHPPALKWPRLVMIYGPNFILCFYFFFYYIFFFQSDCPCAAFP